MRADILSQLQCPFCTQEIRLDRIITGDADDVRNALLSCSGCTFEFPVIAGVAILFGPDDTIDVHAETNDQINHPGPTTCDLAGALKAGDVVQALSLLLGPTSDLGRLDPPLPGPTSQTNDLRASWDTRIGKPVRQFHPPVGGRAYRFIRRQFRELRMPQAQRRLAEHLVANERKLSALEVIDLFYRQFSGAEIANYFAFRFGQPRHLASLALASFFTNLNGPILDLACGLGHLTHFLTSANPDRLVIGVDRDFFRLYVASRFTAPRAAFICAPADQPLPFRHESFGAILCSDAFHYFLHRAGCIRNLQRILGKEGLLVLSRFGNREVEPREGYELSLDGYRRLFAGMTVAFCGEERLIDDYLQRRSPDLSAAEPLETLRQQKWLSAVAVRHDARLPESKSFKTWPHSLGKLQVNPIYQQEAVGESNGANLRFHHPSPWYEFENKRYQIYTPAQRRVSREALQALSSGTTSKEIEELINQFVVIGLPERYGSGAASLLRNLQDQWTKQAG